MLLIRPDILVVESNRCLNFCIESNFGKSQLCNLRFLELFEDGLYLIKALLDLNSDFFG